MKPFVLAAIFAALFGTLSEANDKAAYEEKSRYDFVTDVTTHSKTLEITSNEDPLCRFSVCLMEDGAGWGLETDNPFRWRGLSDKIEVTFRGSAKIIGLLKA
jgi:hypothetical protein